VKEDTKRDIITRTTLLIQENGGVASEMALDSKFGKMALLTMGNGSWDMLIQKGDFLIH
jgi:hypothetical protein